MSLLVGLMLMLSEEEEVGNPFFFTGFSEGANSRPPENFCMCPAACHSFRLLIPYEDLSCAPHCIAAPLITFGLAVPSDPELDGANGGERLNPAMWD